MKHVVFVNRFYAPDTAATGQLLSDLATGLVRQGWNVTVITTRPKRDESDSAAECGVTVIRLTTPRRTDGSLVGKVVAFATFQIRALLRLMTVAGAGAIVVVMTDPPLLAIPATLVARLKHARIIHWLQDIYPEVAVAVTGHRWVSMIKPLRNVAWRWADRCVAVSHEMATVTAAAGVRRDRAVVIPNWAPSGVSARAPDDADVRAVRKSLGIEGQFAVVYSGNLGRVHDLDCVIEAATQLRNDARVAFLLMGNGPQRHFVEGEIAKRNLTNVRFAPPQPRERLSAALGAADVHLVTLRAGCQHFVFPSKFYGILAAGRPVIFVGPRECELAREIASRGVGIAFANGEAAKLAAVLRDLAGAPDRIAALRRAALAAGKDTTLARPLAAWNDLLQRVHVS